jgi:hypothetical protein
VLTAADVNTRAQELLENADLGFLQDDEMLLNRCVRLHQPGYHTGVYVSHDLQCCHVQMVWLGPLNALDTRQKVAVTCASIHIINRLWRMHECMSRL